MRCLPPHGRGWWRISSASSPSSSSCSAEPTVSRATRSRICGSRPARTAVPAGASGSSPSGSDTAGCWRSAAADITATISLRPGTRCWKTSSRGRPVSRGSPSRVARGQGRPWGRSGTIFALPPASAPSRPSRMFRTTDTIAEFDNELWAAMQGEKARQEDHIELIASENYASPRVLEAQGSVLTNKYAEGYPGKRYYGGCEYVDIAEQLAIDRAKQLFGADYANVQPHSGSQANAAAYFALVQPGDPILGMSLDHGGHLTHGAKVNFSGEFFKAAQYGIRADTGEIDYEQVQRLAEEHRPKMIIAGFSAYSRVVDWARFAAIAKSVGAYFVVDMAHVAGLIAAGIYPNPVPHADVVTTTTHKTLRGPRGGLILARANDEITKKLSSLVFPGTQGGPLMHVIAAKAVALLEALQPEFKEYQFQVLKNARAMAARLVRRDYQIVSGGTDNHLFLMSLVDRNITGKDADAALGRANITVNKNAVPNDPRPPMVSSGLRLGSPASTTRGFKEAEFQELSGWIADILDHMGDEKVVAATKQKVLALCKKYPVYGGSVKF